MPLATFALVLAAAIGAAGATVALAHATGLPFAALGPVALALSLIFRRGRRT